MPLARVDGSVTDGTTERGTAPQARARRPPERGADAEGPPSLRPHLAALIMGSALTAASFVAMVFAFIALPPDLESCTGDEEWCRYVAESPVLDPSAFSLPPCGRHGRPATTPSTTSLGSRPYRSGSCSWHPLSAWSASRCWPGGRARLPSTGVSGPSCCSALRSCPSPDSSSLRPVASTTCRDNERWGASSKPPPAHDRPTGRRGRSQPPRPIDPARPQQLTQLGRQPPVVAVVRMRPTASSASSPGPTGRRGRARRVGVPSPAARCACRRRIISICRARAAWSSSARRRAGPSTNARDTVPAAMIDAMTMSRRVMVLSDRIERFSANTWRPGSAVV